MDNNNMYNNDDQYGQTDGGSEANGVFSGYGEAPSNEYQCPQQGGYQQELEEPVSMGEWLIALLLIVFVPCVNIILMFVWAFSKNEKKSKSNFFKAYLIMTAISTVLAIILCMVFGVALAGAASSMGMYY